MRTVKDRRKQDARTVLLRESRRLDEGDLPLVFQILLVAHQDDHDASAGQRSRVLQPSAQMVVRFATNKEDETGVFQSSRPCPTPKPMVECIAARARDQPKPTYLVMS